VCVFYLFIHQWALDVSSVCMRFSYLLVVVLGNVGQAVEECLPVLISFIDSIIRTHVAWCCVPDHYVILGYATPGVGSVSTCFILLDVRRGIAALRIPGLWRVDSFDERLTCRVSLRDYECLRATWFAENLGL